MVAFEATVLALDAGIQGSEKRPTPRPWARMRRFCVACSVSFSGERIAIPTGAMLTFSTRHQAVIDYPIKAAQLVT